MRYRGGAFCSYNTSAPEALLGVCKELYGLSPDEVLPVEAPGKSLSFGNERIPETARAADRTVTSVASLLRIRFTGASETGCQSHPDKESRNLDGTPASFLREHRAPPPTASGALVPLGDDGEGPEMDRMETPAHHTHDLSRSRMVTSWTMLAVILFGPSEPLIPLIVVGHGVRSHSILAVVGAFAVTMIGMMLLQVHCSTSGVPSLRSHRFEHASQMISVGALALTGAAIRISGI